MLGPCANHPGREAAAKRLPEQKARHVQEMVLVSMVLANCWALDIPWFKLIGGPWIYHGSSCLMGLGYAMIPVERWALDILWF